MEQFANSAKIKRYFSCRNSLNCNFIFDYSMQSIITFIYLKNFKLFWNSLLDLKNIISFLWGNLMCDFIRDNNYFQ
jgi:hypothetical protein